MYQMVWQSSTKVGQALVERIKRLGSLRRGVEEVHRAVRVTYMFNSIGGSSSLAQAICRKWQWRCTNKARGANFLIWVWTPVCFPENVLAPLKPIPTILLTWSCLSFNHSARAESLHLLASGELPPKMLLGWAIFWQNTDTSSMVATSVHLSAMMLKHDTWRRRVWTPQPMSQELLWIPQLLRVKCTHDITNSTSFSKFVVWGMCWRARSVHNKRMLSCSLFTPVLPHCGAAE